MLFLPGPLKLPATVAIFDCGTNSVLLLVARLRPNGKVSPLHQAKASPRLGEGLTGSGKLKPKAIVRTLRELKKLKDRAVCFKPGLFLGLGTNIFRRARDGRAAARRLEKELGFPFLVLSASEEARLEFMGATFGLKTNSKITVIDVGGGSSEVIWGKGRKIEKKISLETGSVRLKEKFVGMKNYDETGLQKLHVEASRKISKLKYKNGYRMAVLTGGTATTLAAFSLGQKKYKQESVHGLKATPEKLKNWLEKLSCLSLRDRKRALSFDATRADIIVPGGIILLEILKRLDVKKVIISDHGLRWGAAYFLLNR